MASDCFLLWLCHLGRNQVDRFGSCTVSNCLGGELSLGPIVPFPVPLPAREGGQGSLSPRGQGSGVERGDRQGRLPREPSQIPPPGSRSRTAGSGRDPESPGSSGSAGPPQGGGTLSRPAGVPYPGTRAGKSSLGTPRGGLPQGRSPAWLLAGRAPRRGKPSRKGGSRKGEEPLGVPAGLGTLTGPGPRFLDQDQIVRLISKEKEEGGAGAGAGAAAEAGAGG